MNHGKNQIDLSGQTAVITGGGGAFGLGIAQRLVASGAQVVLWNSDGEALDRAVKILPQANSQVVDVRDFGAIENAVTEIENSVGDISILVNCAGIAGPTSSLVDYPIEEWARVIDVNLVGTFLVNKGIVPGMIKRKYGRILNIASVAGKEGNPNASAYSASKAGVIGLTKSLGKELAEYDIGVNALAPAVANTPLLKQGSKKLVEYMLSKIPKGRFLEIDEMASMAAWLVSPENSFTTGAVFDLSGGRATY